MSRIGKKPILLPAGITVSVGEHAVDVVGPKGTLSVHIPPEFSVCVSERTVTLVPVGKGVESPHFLGLFRSLLNNAIVGVEKEWTKTLELVGVGYRGQVSGNQLTLHLGFSHPVNFAAPQGIRFSVHGNTLVIEGADKYLVGEIAASIRRVRPPEPYKGKGIRYLGEQIRRKAGKAGKAAGSPVAK